ncbi:MAG: restriction endonuclease subunit S [Clostridia bacterium]|nr:restriction endonuclease subunit S [Clostridia bacterium]
MLYKKLVRKVSISPEIKIKQKEYFDKGTLPIVDQGRELIGGYTDRLELRLPCELPVIVFGDHTRAVKYIDFQFAAGADGIKVLQPNKSVFPKYLYYATQYLVLRLEDRGYARHYQYVEKKEIDIPAIDEQKCIVAKIEELFSELDNSVETLQKTKEQLTVYRQATLKKIFQSCDMWIAIESVCQHVTDGDHLPPPKAEQGIPFIMISNIENNIINWDNTAYVKEEYYNNLDNKRRPCEGDVLYTVTGSYGIPVLVNYEKDFCFQRHIALLRPNNKINPRFLFYAMQSPDVYAQATKVATGTAQKTVGLGVLRKIKIPYYDDLKKQCEIVNDIETKLTICHNLEKTVDTTLQQAEAMRQSILKKAFEGKL